jgi:hypothetical protein
VALYEIWSLPPHAVSRGKAAPYGELAALAERFAGSPGTGESANARGALAQLVERLLCKHQVNGSNPLSSTTHQVPGMTEISFVHVFGHGDLGDLPPL